MPREIQWDRRPRAGKKRLQQRSWLNRFFPWGCREPLVAGGGNRADTLAVA
jgi:hypothetical protein